MKGERSWKQAGKAVQKCSKIAAIKLAQQQKKNMFWRDYADNEIHSYFLLDQLSISILIY